MKKIILASLLFTLALPLTSEAKKRRVVDPSLSSPTSSSSGDDEYSFPNSSASPSYSSSSSSASSSGSSKKFAIGGGLGFYSGNGGALAVDDKGADSLGLSGIIGIAAEGEMPMGGPLQLGANFRYYSSSDDFKAGTTTRTKKESLWTLGGHGKVTFFHADDFSGYIGFGLGLVSGSTSTSLGGTTTEIAPGVGFGLTHSLGLLYRVKSGIHVGVENFRILGLGAAYNGWLVSDLMLKFRMQL